jgi:hypothetical protein
MSENAIINSKSTQWQCPEILDINTKTPVLIKVTRPMEDKRLPIPLILLSITPCFSQLLFVILF